MRPAAGDDRFQALTPRQREVLQLLAEGHTSKEIAGILAVSTKTVEFHKGRIKTELGLRSIAELTQFAVKRGLVSS
jgi:DNA-binding CsgD family transcriptional regulator